MCPKSFNWIDHGVRSHVAVAACTVMSTFTFCLPIYPVNGIYQQVRREREEEGKMLESGDSLVRTQAHTEFYYAKLNDQKLLYTVYCVSFSHQMHNHGYI